MAVVILGALARAKIEDGELWLLNRQETRRRRSLWGERRRRAVHGMARDCGHSCFFKLRQSGRSDMRIRLVRWLQLPKPRNKQSDSYWEYQVQTLLHSIVQI
uniref:Uncharacterized protein n=1 Tax=Parascaris equorum TaxID=6256 RepID=A0A914REL6_PAREQ